MIEKLQVIICNAYQPEVEALPPAFLPDVKFSFFSGLCRNPPLELPDLQAILAGCTDCSHRLVIGAATCLRRLERTPSTQYKIETHGVGQCLYLVAPRSMVDSEQRDGAYCVTRGWLTNWQERLDGWGFDRDTAAAFFGESTQRVVLLDTLDDDRGPNDLAAFATAVGLPHSVVPVGLDHFTANITRIVGGVLARENSRTSSSSVDSPHLQADYAVALDLLGTQFQARHSATGAINGILDTLQMLFAPEQVRFLATFAGAEDQLHTLGAEPRPVSSEAPIRFGLSDAGHAFTPDGTGFLFRVGLGGNEIGIAEVDRVAFPTAIQSYLNLALAIAPVCAAVIANGIAHDEVERSRELLESSNAELRHANNEWEAVVRELRSLQEVLPICAWCNTVLDNEGGWTKLASYLANYTGAKFSHGICVGCEEKIYPPE